MLSKLTQSEYYKIVIVALLSSIGGIFAASSWGILTDYFIYNDQFSVKTYFLERSTDTGTFKLDIPFQIDNPNYMLVVENNNKYRNLTLTGLKIKVDFNKLIFLLPDDLEKSYEGEMGFLEMFYKMSTVISSKKSPFLLDSLKSKYEKKNPFEFFYNKLSDILIDVSKPDISDDLRKLYLYYSDQNNYNEKGDIIKDMVKLMKISLDLNFIDFLDDFPIEIKANESRLVKVPKLLTKIIKFSKEKKLTVCFTDKKCKSVDVPANFEDEDFRPFEARYGNEDMLSKHGKAFNEIYDNMEKRMKSEKFGYELFISSLRSDFKEIDGNLRRRYFNFSDDRKTILLFYEIVDIFKVKYKKTVKKFKIKNNDAKTKTLKYGFEQIEKAFDRGLKGLPPQMLISFIKKEQTKILQQLVGEDELKV